MIEGLKLLVKGTELVELCRARATYHRDRAHVYATQEKSMAEAGIELGGSNTSSGNPKQDMINKRRQHENDAAEMAFIAAHIDHNEVYKLDRADLYKLGISSQSF